MDFARQLLTQAREDFPFFMEFGLNITAALAILILGWMIARTIRRKLRSPSFGPDNIDLTLRPVIASTVFYIIIAVTLYAALTKIGIPATSLLAIFGAAGLAVALALRGTLSNIASGVMLLILRPLNVGDFVDTPMMSGTVKEVGLFATTIIDPEGIYSYIPNSQVWNSRIQNFGRHSERKFIESIAVGYDTDLEKTQTLLLKVLASAPDVKEHPSMPECYVTSFEESAIKLSCRCWLPADEWSRRSSDLRVAIKAALDKAGIEMPYPQRVVRTKNI